jgi:acetyltransferase
MRTIFHEARDSLKPFFEPKSIAVVGASERTGSIGRTLVWNLVTSPFGGLVLPINPKRASVLGIRAYPTLADAPSPIDLAIIATPANTVPTLVGECQKQNIPAALIISAGFAEMGSAGAEIERQLQSIHDPRRTRIIGPNCLGLMNPSLGLNATFAATPVLSGNVAMLSQSGAILTAVLDWSIQEGIGFSKVVSVGAMLDVGWGDLIDYLARDPHTRSILIYMESIGDPKSFMSAARAAASRTPIIVLKGGRTAPAMHAAASHTGAMACRDDIIDAAFLRCGVLRVRSTAGLFNMADLLTRQSLSGGPRLTIVTNAGGPGVLATDALVGSGGQLSDLTDQSMKALGDVLPPHWSQGNPIDVLGDASPTRFQQAVSIALSDANTDGVLVILTPQAMTNPTQTAQEIAELAKESSKPILAAWLGGTAVAAGRSILSHAGVAEFPYPEAAARAFHYLWKHSENLSRLYETPIVRVEDQFRPDPKKVAEILRNIRDKGRSVVAEHEAKDILNEYGIDVVPTRFASTESEAVRHAQRIGYPVALKVVSESATHKARVGGVKLNLQDESAVRCAFRDIQSSLAERASQSHFEGVTVQPMVGSYEYELILGSSVDPHFGPVILFGAGGSMAEIQEDYSLALPPLHRPFARQLIERTKISKALRGEKGSTAVDIPLIESILVRLSELIVDQPCIKEIDINPLAVSGGSAIVLDARMILHDAQLPEHRWPRPVIRPYPSRYTFRFSLSDGRVTTLRPIRPEDEPLLIAFHQGLSELTVYQRYFLSIQLNQRVAHERLSRLCFIDYEREIALVAEVCLGDGQKQVIAVARLIRQSPPDTAEFAVLVSDPFQGQGLGTELVRRLVEIAVAEKIRTIQAVILPDNQAMRSICSKIGFQCTDAPSPGEVLARLELSLSATE